MKRTLETHPRRLLGALAVLALAATSMLSTLAGCVAQAGDDDADEPSAPVAEATANLVAAPAPAGQAGAPDRSGGDAEGGGLADTLGQPEGLSDPQPNPWHDPNDMGPDPKQGH